MQTVGEIYQFLCELAPPELQLSFDNAGFLVGRKSSAVTRVLLALDITEPVVQEAIEQDAQLIVSHHPVIFGSINRITDQDGGEKLLRLIENRIAAICMHTNLDIAQGGVNDVLMRTLGLEPSGALDADGCGRIGTLPSTMPLREFLGLCKERLGAEGLRYYDAGKPVSKLAVMGGAGAGAIADAVSAGCDTYVTADVKYHQFQLAAEHGLNLIDADHYYTENPVMSDLAEKLRGRFPDLQIELSQVHKAVASFF